jgi:hypothetical protein
MMIDEYVNTLNSFYVLVDYTLGVGTTPDGHMLGRGSACPVVSGLPPPTSRPSPRPAGRQAPAPKAPPPLPARPPRAVPAAARVPWYQYPGLAAAWSAYIDRQAKVAESDECRRRPRASE